MVKISLFLLALLVSAPLIAEERPHVQIGTFTDRSDFRLLGCNEFFKQGIQSRLEATGRYQVGSSNSWTLTGTILKIRISSRGIESSSLASAEILETSVQLVLSAKSSKTNLSLIETENRKETSADFILKQKDRTVSLKEMAKKMVKMDARTPEFAKTPLAETMGIAMDKIVWKFSKAVLGKPYGYRAKLEEVRGDYVYIINERMAAFAPKQDFVLQNAEYYLGAIGQGRKATVNAIVMDLVEFHVPGHMFKNGDTILLN